MIAILFIFPGGLALIGYTVSGGSIWGAIVGAVVGLCMLLGE